jgi:hypothetical protein
MIDVPIAVVDGNANYQSLNDESDLSCAGSSHY